MVDRYNIYYAYVPTRLSQRIHRAAVGQVVVAPLLCLLWLLFFSVLRLGPMHPITLFTFACLVCCVTFALFRLFLRKQPDKSTSYPLFVPSVLLEPELGLTPMPSPAHQTYGALTRSQSRSSHGPVEEQQEDDDREDGGEDGDGGPSATRETQLQDPQDPHYCSVMDSPVGYQ
ncbi:hypothetical protein CRUP_004783 [Coryphaenoides rupestris]|nr:hypothetical protein CRUP_004783 [Coryphaenoides rupestris]